MASENPTRDLGLKIKDLPHRGGRACGVCVCALGVWNGRRDWLLCANYPGPEGELSHVSGAGVVVECRKFRPKPTLWPWRKK